MARNTMRVWAALLVFVLASSGNGQILKNPLYIGVSASHGKSSTMGDISGLSFGLLTQPAEHFCDREVLP